MQHESAEVVKMLAVIKPFFNLVYDPKEMSVFPQMNIKLFSQPNSQVQVRHDVTQTDVTRLHCPQQPNIQLG